MSPRRTGDGGLTCAGRIKRLFEGVLMSRSLRTLGVSALGGAMLLLALAIVGCNRGSEAAQPPPRPPTVTVSDVVVRDVPYYVDEIGRCAASDSVALTPQVAGR